MPTHGGGIQQGFSFHHCSEMRHRPVRLGLERAKGDVLLPQLLAGNARPQPGERSRPETPQCKFFYNTNLVFTFQM